MNLEKYKQQLKENSIIVSFRLLIELKDEYFQLIKGLGIINQHKYRNKAESLLLKKTHSIEKGLSLPNPRVGFGESKILDLIKEIKFFIQRYPDSEYVNYAINVLLRYQEFNKKHDYLNKEISGKVNELVSHYSIFRKMVSGIKEISVKDIYKSNFDFAEFARSRHSIRQFTDKDVSDNVILQALDIAKRSPSACNRQPWHTYVFRGQKKNDLLVFQGGAKGFSDYVNTAILITSDLGCFDINEIHQAYIDGGIYTSSLLYAFHSIGIGSIPLTTGFKRRKIQEFYRQFKIPKNEVPIVIVGIGYLPETFNVAYSIRKDINTTNTFVS